ncbi:MAG: transcription/translation regulatory transformer protein RfaH [Rhodocyclaceae bacterium]|jgi:transcriptional antiterminator RfaH|uniref:Transcription antitermination protein RfaH n=1 Tax=Fluviibacter phosphoraccumulans TaxID=1751046 RepID=A0A7R6TN74_9RHOO|nr:transcription/translation regulatory transformer protein RfaH [Fluviibacter phosphoraccumulans]MBP7917709.1 transcription/translation regulatory transformer protein RfaH [Rhodocyclaceae bacterium]MBP7991130.1 transcription/translation regulatory transformer protein RfaH [Rhodocyclaceae bacterium]BBU68215.1 transcription antitermination protein RfaH [Fluviibacter phosphoraccumulans]BBU70246.1 transcription antitermination protein RfaH [Fluviibacter phosphoraccumulans]
MARAWYLVQSKPRNEMRALENLVRQGYETYLPLMEVERLQRGKLLKKMEPLFPRYLFLHLEEGNDNWGPIRSTMGVAGLVRFGQAYAVVSDDVLEAVRVRTQDVKKALFTPGDSIRVVSGPLLGLEGVFDITDGEQRSFVLLEFMQKQQRVSVSTADLRAGL